MCLAVCKIQRGGDCVTFDYNQEDKSCSFGDIQGCTVLFDSDSSDLKNVALMDGAFETKKSKLIFLPLNAIIFFLLFMCQMFSY